jgi:hypothetical protein
LHNQFRAQFRTRNSITVDHFKAVFFEAAHFKTIYFKRMVSGFALLASSLAASGVAAEIYTNTSLSAGYRIDTLDWSIAGDTTGNNPNVLSELTWDSLNILQIGIESDISIGQKVYMRGNLSGGYIYSGEVRDSDYAADNRTLEFSR